MSIADYWTRDTAGKERIIQDIPTPKTRCVTKVCHCRHADAEKCYTKRFSGWNPENKTCSCECHSH